VSHQHSLRMSVRATMSKNVSIRPHVKPARTMAVFAVTPGARPSGTEPDGQLDSFAIYDGEWTWGEPWIAEADMEHTSTWHSYEGSGASTTCGGGGGSAAACGAVRSGFSGCGGAPAGRSGGGGGERSGGGPGFYGNGGGGGGGGMRGGGG
jgi:hypothetical protein